MQGKFVGVGLKNPQKNVKKSSKESQTSSWKLKNLEFNTSDKFAQYLKKYSYKPLKRRKTRLEILIERHRCRKIELAAINLFDSPNET